MEDTGTFDQTECKVHISRALRENGMVKFMVDALNKAGCPWDPDKFTCITCDAPVEAGFDKSNDSIKICGNNVTNYDAVSLVSFTLIAFVIRLLEVGVGPCLNVLAVAGGNT